jgi:hypothetical protein
MLTLSRHLGAFALALPILAYAQFKDVRAAPIPTAGFTLISTIPSEPFSDNLKFGSIDSPALYQFIISRSGFEEREGSTDFEYVNKFEPTPNLQSGILGFDPGASPPDGFLYPHYLTVAFDFEEIEENDFEFTAFDFVDSDNPPTTVSDPAFLYLISGCNSGPCLLDIGTLLSDIFDDEEIEEIFPEVVRISIYNSGTVIPLPPAILLFGTGVAALAYAGRRKRKAAQAAA